MSVISDHIAFERLHSEHMRQSYGVSPKHPLMAKYHPLIPYIYKSQPTEMLAPEASITSYADLASICQDFVVSKIFAVFFVGTGGPQLHV